MEKFCYISGKLHDGTELPDARDIIMKATEFGNIEIFHAIAFPFVHSKFPEDMLVLVEISQCSFEVFKGVI